MHRVVPLTFFAAMAALLGPDGASAQATTAAVRPTPTPTRAPASGAPSMDAVAIPSHGARLNGLIYRAAGDGPHPVAVFFHGFPGNEKNLDLAQAVRRAGWDAVYFDYRGSWGSGGTFSLANSLEDVAAVLAWLRAPANASKYRLDASRVAIVGHSFGGWLALLGARREPPQVCVAAIAAWNVGWTARHLDDAGLRDDEVSEFRDATDPAGGPLRTTADALMKELTSAPASWDYLSEAGLVEGPRSSPRRRDAGHAGRGPRDARAARASDPRRRRDAREERDARRRPCLLGVAPASRGAARRVAERRLRGESAHGEMMRRERSIVRGRAGRRSRW